MTPSEHKELSDTAARWKASADDRCCGSWLNMWLLEHEPVASVPLTELLIYRSECGGVDTRLDALIAKHSPKPALPPNPHQQGTYLWAREENARDRTVFRASHPRKMRIIGNAIWDEDLRFTTPTSSPPTGRLCRE